MRLQQPIAASNTKARAQRPEFQYPKKILHEKKAEK